MPRPVDALLAAVTGGAALLVGVVTGALGTVAHSGAVVAGPVLLPVGLVVAVGLLLASDVALRLTGGRALLLLSGGARLLVVLLLATRRPEGDLLVVDGGRGLAWLLLASCLPVVVAMWPRPAPGRAPAAAR